MPTPVCHYPMWPAPQPPSVRSLCADTEQLWRNAATSGIITSAVAPTVAMAPPCVSFTMFPWLWVGVPRCPAKCALCAIKDGFGALG